MEFYKHFVEGRDSGMILPKNQMTEEDIKLNYITPALVSRGWQNKITMETPCR